MYSFFLERHFVAATRFFWRSRCRLTVSALGSVANVEAGLEDGALRAWGFICGEPGLGCGVVSAQGKGLRSK